jgi:hypothetical protein
VAAPLRDAIKKRPPRAPMRWGRANSDNPTDDTVRASTSRQRGKGSKHVPICRDRRLQLEAGGVVKRVRTAGSSQPMHWKSVRPEIVTTGTISFPHFGQRVIRSVRSSRFFSPTISSAPIAGRGARSYRPPVHMFKLTETQKTMPYVGVHPDDEQ